LYSLQALDIIVVHQAVYKNTIATLRSLSVPTTVKRQILLPRTALFSVITQRVVVISYRHFGTTCRFHRQGSFPETSVRNYYYSLRNNPEVLSFHLSRGGSLK